MTEVLTAVPREGLDRCWCGAKYWDGTTCHSCGEEWDPQTLCGECHPDGEWTVFEVTHCVTCGVRVAQW